MTNVTDRDVRIELSADDLGSSAKCWRDAIEGDVVQTTDERLNLSLAPYDNRWLTPENEYRERRESVVDDGLIDYPHLTLLFTGPRTHAHMSIGFSR